jgi:hypothetical protein
MLSEFYCIFIFIVPVVVFVLSFSKVVDSKFSDENKMHSSIYSFFMKDDCGRYAKCSDSQIEVTDAYKIKVKKPSKALGSATNKGGVQDEPLDLFYKEFEQKIKANTGQ